jgi:tRNA A37 threonylcarbamoyladenosine dehydratase
MGAANKIDPTAFRVSDLSDTQKDPLARILRKTLRKEGIINLKVVYSEETPLRPVEQLPTNNQQECAEQTEEIPNSTTRRDIPASNAFVPAAAGLIIGGEVVKDIIAQPVQ